MTFFFKISVRRSKIIPRIFYSLKKAKNFQKTVSFLYKFSKQLSNKFPYDFLTFNFSHFNPQVRLFFVEKET